MNKKFTILFFLLFSALIVNQAEASGKHHHKHKGHYYFRTAVHVLDHALNDHHHHYGRKPWGYTKVCSFDGYHRYKCKYKPHGWRHKKGHYGYYGHGHHGKHKYGHYGYGHRGKHKYGHYGHGHYGHKRHGHKGKKYCKSRGYH